MSSSSSLVVVSLLLFFAAGGAPLIRSVQGSRSPPSKLKPMQPTPNNNSSRWRYPMGGMTHDIDGDIVLHFATSESLPAEFYGAKGHLSIHYLHELANHQCSSIDISLLANPDNSDVICAGWHVCPWLYGDDSVHFFTRWTADDFQSTGCHNLDCPGFVLRKEAPLIPGTPLNIMNQMTIAIKKDMAYGDWVLYLDSSEVGRWPSSLFSGLSTRANLVFFNGRVAYDKGAVGPPMGSGHFPGPSSAIVRHLQFVDDSGSFVDFGMRDFTIYADAPECYDATLTPRSEGTGVDFHYGGPTGCTNN